MSQQRDYLGRWLPTQPKRSGRAILEEICGCVLLVICIYAACIWGF